MAYLGTPPRSRVLSSADIGTGAVTLDDISFTDQPTSVNVSGAINKHTMRLADQVVIDGDVTISDNLILSKISDDGNAITLTNDSSTRTITGSGSLEASTLTQTPNASLSGMTGVIGSDVTGTLGSGIIFPTGNVIWSAFTDFGAGQSQAATATTTVYSTTVITVPSIPAGASLLAVFSGGFSERSSGYGNDFGFNINGVAYDRLCEGTQDWREARTMQQYVAFPSSASNVVVKISSTKTGGSYQEFKLGGVAPATMSVFISK